MKSVFYKLLVRIRRVMWGLIVAYMLGFHNFYKGEDKDRDSILKSPNTLEQHEGTENGVPED